MALTIWKVAQPMTKQVRSFQQIYDLVIWWQIFSIKVAILLQGKDVCVLPLTIFRYIVVHLSTLIDFRQTPHEGRLLFFKCEAFCQKGIVYYFEENKLVDASSSYVAFVHFCIGF